MKDRKNLPWENIYEDLNEKGYAVIPEILTDPECTNLKTRHKKSTRESPDAIIII